jgi:NAD(P)-dependent dehydrogenase (short-subunit alcohol dehydrogenase family)
LLFAREGGTVVVADLDLEGAAETVRLVGAEAGSASAHMVDVTEPDQAQRLADDAVRQHGQIDVLFNNAGIPGVGTAHETDVDDFDRVMRVNVRGVFLVAKYVLPHMIAQGSGSIINMSSAIATIGLANRVPYSASKGAVLSMTRSMQVDCAPYGIRVNALMPGTIYSPFVERYLRESYPDPQTGLEAIKRRQLSGELGRPEDAAAAALFLASDESRFVMGSGLVVDGGLTAGK